MPRAQHIRELPYLLRVSNRLIEGVGKVMRTENGNVGIVRFQFLVAVAVDHREIVVVIFLRNKSAGVLAESADFIFERLGITDEFGFVQYFIDRLHDLVSHFHPNADVDGARNVLHAVFFAQLFQPIRSAAARRNHGIGSENFQALAAVRLGDGNALTYSVFDNQRIAFVIEENFHAATEKIFFNGKVDTLRLFRTHVTNRAIHQFESRLNGALADFLDFFARVQTFDVFVRAEFEINFIRIIDRLLREFFADELRQIAAHFAA